MISIVVPTMNEERTVTEFIAWCKEGFQKAGCEGEILIMDSSSDKTPEIAESLGARVVRVAKRGLGRAYMDALPHIRGKYVVMGDADCTYDFREIGKFIEKLDQGYEYVMGTRMKGVIEKGAMPGLHQYFGTPLTTWILNTLMGTRFSDIHCGLRAMTLETLKKIDIQSESWEYASEMVVKAGLLGLRSCEVPIHFYKDREGRVSHHRRLGWFSPWYAGWINLKVMLLYAPHQMLVKPGIGFWVLGFGLVLMQIAGPVAVGPITFSASFMLLGLTLAVLGLSSVQMGILVETFSDLERFYQSRIATLLKCYFTYTNGMICGAISLCTGLIFSLGFVAQWISQDYRLSALPWYAVLGLLLVISGIQTVLFNLVYQAFLIQKHEKN